ncbi:hypothetical protein E4U54_003306 [Claviceps lovelessii]|nr:hypothetical protein E4U54_003306 [Claviceps lovelessii]
MAAEEIDTVAIQIWWPRGVRHWALGAENASPGRQADDRLVPKPKLVSTQSYAQGRFHIKTQDQESRTRTLLNRERMGPRLAIKCQKNQHMDKAAAALTSRALQHGVKLRPALLFM